MEYDFDNDKNEWLKRERNVSFETIITAIDNDFPRLSIEHPNQTKYPGQLILIINIHDIFYAVPYSIVSDNIIMLITLFECNKYKKLFKEILK